MTPYERMMLTMMSHMLAGMAHLATQPNLATDQDHTRHAQAVLDWQNQVSAVIGQVQKVLSPSDAAGWRTPGLLPPQSRCPTRILVKT